MIIIPANNDPSQVFNLDIEGSSWTFRIAYNSLSNLWYLGLDKDGVSVLNGVNIVSGLNLVRAFNFMKGYIIAVMGGDTRRDPIMGDWENGAELIYFSPEEVQQIIAGLDEPTI